MGWADVRAVKASPTGGLWPALTDLAGVSLVISLSANDPGLTTTGHHVWRLSCRGMTPDLHFTGTRWHHAWMERDNVGRVLAPLLAALIPQQ